MALNISNSNRLYNQSRLSSTTRQNLRQVEDFQKVKNGKRKRRRRKRIEKGNKSI